MTPVNERLHSVLAQRGIPPESLAEICEVDPKTVGRWLGGRVPHARHRFRVARHLRVEELFLWPAPERSSQQQSAGSEPELVTTYQNRASVPRDTWLSLLKGAQEQIGVLVFSGTFFAQSNPHVAKMLAERASDGVRVRLCFGDSYGQAAAIRGQEEGIGDTLAAKIRASLTYYRPLLPEAGCEVRLHEPPSTPPCSATTTTSWSTRTSGASRPAPTPSSISGELVPRAGSTTTLRVSKLSGPPHGPGHRTRRGPRYMGRTEYYNDPKAPKANTLIPANNLLVVDDNGAILLQRRRDTGQWALPGGAQDIGETAAQCAVRECLEETGIIAEVTGFLGVYTNPNHIVAYTDGEIRQQYENTYIGRPVGGEPTINDEADGVRYVQPNDLDEYDIHPSMRQQIGDYLAGTYPYLG